MAAHLHTQIRSAVVSALTGLTTTGGRVYANRLLPLPDALSPTLNITLDEETAEVGIQRFTDRRLTLAVTAYAKASAALDDTLDQVAKEVEIALAAGVLVDGVMLDCFYTGMSFEDALADKPVGVRRMTFAVPFTALADAPDSL